jgi:hypothetical protein
MEALMVSKLAGDEEKALFLRLLAADQNTITFAEARTIYRTKLISVLEKCGYVEWVKVPCGKKKAVRLLPYGHVWAVILNAENR